jgi:DNA repair exonuclease SbcCD ATPase subunit
MLARTVTTRGLDTMPIEQLTYQEFADRLRTTPEGARALTKRRNLQRLPGNDGKTRVMVDFSEFRHTPLRRSKPAPQDPMASLTAQLETLRAELAAEKERSDSHRLDYEHELTRADQLVIEINAVRRLMEVGTIPQDHFTAEMAAERERSANHRSDFERERTRADQLVTEVTALRVLLEEAAQASPQAQLLDGLAALRRAVEDLRRSTTAREVTTQTPATWWRPWRRLRTSAG